MTQQTDTSEDQPVLPALKVVEPAVDPDDPWHDDVLDRKEIADRLTSIVRGQEAPFVISLDGRWGTGKTFLLKRWAQDLRNQDPKWQAIYYNAWEDDFAGNPLLSITGQLSEHLGKEKFSEKVRGVLGKLVRPAYFAGSVASTATIGMPLPGLPGGNQTDPDHLGGYHQMRAARDELKQSLTELATEVRSETGQPLIFIIDELDRCRPTFAIELLERVKHIFDVPNIVFVLGINREELTKSLESVYGEIDTGTYLRRFFDMEFVLPDADPTRFCTHLLEQFQLLEFLRGLTTSTGRHRATDDLPPENWSRSHARIGVAKGAGMARKRSATEQIIAKLREAEVALAQGDSVATVVRQLGVAEQTYYRWRREYGGLQVDQAKRLKELEKENQRLRRVVADQARDNAILKEVASGNF